jgi:hypothetical protein
MKRQLQTFKDFLEEAKDPAYFQAVVVPAMKLKMIFARYQRF